MSAAALISIILIIYLHKTLKDSPDAPPWVRYLRFAWIPLMILSFTFESMKVRSIFDFIWIGLMLFLLSFILKRREFSNSRSLLVAVLPLAILSFITAFLNVWNFEIIEKINSYIEIAYPFAFIWLGAYLIIYRKQKKTLAKERQKLEEEERLNKVIAARKDELENLVTERTAEITKQKEELQNTLVELTATQGQLIHSEKMASLGELTAGIAHEIQNPLNFVNNFSDVNTELIAEMEEAIRQGNIEEVKAIANDIRDNNSKITHHGKRADAIVKGMLQHSRTSTGQKEPTDINALADEYLRLAYHGLRAKDKSFNTSYETHLDPQLPKINVIPQDFGRVILNLFNNAFYAVAERKKKEATGYKPNVILTTRRIRDQIEIVVADNGGGIPHNILDKIFQPFFTTKPTGQGTGLGLSLSYDIVTKGHGGNLRVETQEGEGTKFIISIPLRQNAQTQA
ncbi:MAG: hypothetical protein JNL23_11595 [Chitinophagaceae bacterium]|nr:hypothetical protein [Chitinophagaceae bacterium]